MNNSQLKLCLKIVKQGNCDEIDCSGSLEGPFLEVSCPLNNDSNYSCDGCEDSAGHIEVFLIRHVEENIEKEQIKSETDKVIGRFYTIQFLDSKGWHTAYTEICIQSLAEARARLKKYRECAAGPNEPEELGEYRIVVDERKVLPEAPK